MRQRDCRI